MSVVCWETTIGVVVDADAYDGKDEAATFLGWRNQNKIFKDEEQI